MNLEVVLWEPDEDSPPVDKAVFDLLHFYNSEFLPVMQQIKGLKGLPSEYEAHEIKFKVDKLHKKCVRNRER